MVVHCSQREALALFTRASESATEHFLPMIMCEKLLFLTNSYWLSRPTFGAVSPTDSNRDQLAQTQMID